MDTKKIVSFEDLEVFQKAYRISLDVHKASLKFPKEEQSALADQARRASKAVCSNIAEGHGKKSFSPGEFKRYLGAALASCDEMRVWSRYCLDLDYITHQEWQQWRDAYKEIAGMLVGLMRTIEDRPKFDRPRSDRPRGEGDRPKFDRSKSERPRGKFEKKS